MRGAGREVRLRSGAALLGACAVAMYTCGLLHVAGDVIEAEDGGSYAAASVPDHVNPAAACFALGAAVCAGAAAVASERRAREVPAA
ncbi:hypothetical protein ACIP98_23465 [Streptomyces sp. NPDC088354]|uniref:hypothetical protein n=1 Tax=Streptomyces sp. NPDC088354 TaxID=3365856 RepID=UPI0038019734